MTTKTQTNTAGDQSRETLVDAGLQLFGEFGYEGVSVRRICDAAGRNVASVTYHFGGKEGLYRAVASRIADEFQALMSHHVVAASKLLEATSPDRRAALDLVLEIYKTIIKLLVPNSPELALWAKFIVRYQLGENVPEHEFDNLQLQALLGTLIGLIRNKPEKQSENRLLGLTFFGQILVFRVNRKSSLHLLGLDEIDAEHTRLIETTVLGNIRTVLEAELVE